MNLSVGYLLGLVFLAVVCGNALGNPMGTTSNSAGSSSDTSTISNADPLSDAGCVLNGAVYHNGDINSDLCMHMKCNNGAWEYTGQINQDCGNCTVEGDSHFWTFDDTKDLEYGHKYVFGGVGNFVITQNGMKNPTFELNANLDACYAYDEDWGYQSCVHSITYHELGITVQLVLPPQIVTIGEHTIPDPRCEIEVIVNGEVKKLTSAVESTESSSGTVLIFKHNHFEEYGNSLCVNIVGSQGLSVSLCRHERNFPRLNVLPMPTLKSNPSKLYGLCNTYTGAPQNYLIARKGLKKVPSTKIEEFANSWRSSCEEVGGRCQGINDTCNGVLDRGLGCNQQVCCIEKKGCELDNIPYEDGAFNDNTCMTMQCRNGAWEFAGQIKEQCGKCTVEGDAHILMFDNTTFLPSPSNKYQFGGKGNYVITQHGLPYGLIRPSYQLFGLNAFIEACNVNHSAGLTCVQNITYYEPGITVEVSLPNQTTDTTFPTSTRLGHNPSDDPNCQFKVKIGDEKVRPTGRAMNIQAKYGNLLLFTHNHIEGESNLFCMDIVGSRGLSVSLCQDENNFSWLYVLPMPTLLPIIPVEYYPSKLYGLCNTYTGLTQGNFTGKEQHHGFVTEFLTQNKTTFEDSWHVPIKKNESCQEAGGVCLVQTNPCQGFTDTQYHCGQGLGSQKCCFEEVTSEKSIQNTSQEE